MSPTAAMTCLEPPAKRVSPTHESLAPERAICDFAGVLLLTKPTARKRVRLWLRRSAR
jgi:hypothetical protein